MSIISAILLLILMQSPSPKLFDIAASKGVKELQTGREGIFLYTFTRAGSRHETLVLLPGAVFQTDSMTATSAHCVSLVAAMPFNLGDGAVLNILANGQAVFQLPLDPAHVRSDRQWKPVRFVIPPGMDQVILRFEVSPGSRGDETSDWIGLAPGNEPGCLFAEF